MLKGKSVEADLNKIAGHCPVERLKAAVRSRAFIRCKKAREVFNACPRRRAVVQRVVVPAIVRGEVHDARARVEDLGGEVEELPNKPMKPAILRKSAGITPRRLLVLILLKTHCVTLRPCF